MGGAKARPASRLSGGLAPARGRSDLPILSRHARSGVPSSVASSQRYRSRINALQSTTPVGGRVLWVKNSAAKASKGRHVKARPCTTMPKTQRARTVPKGPSGAAFSPPPTFHRPRQLPDRAGPRLWPKVSVADRAEEGLPQLKPSKFAAIAKH